jgi:membrane-bound lytic murein transglycosylase D
VKRGDSLYSIAKKYPGVSIADLKKWNDIRGEAIKPGMKLKLMVNINHFRYEVFVII